MVREEAKLTLAAADVSSMYLTFVAFDFIGLGILGLIRAELKFTIKKMQASRHPCGAPPGACSVILVTEDKNSFFEEKIYKFLETNQGTSYLQGPELTDYGLLYYRPCSCR